MYGESGSDSLDHQSDRYFTENRDYEEDIEKFVRSLSDQAPLTVKLKISNIRTFLVENDVELSLKFAEVRRRIKGNRALTLDKVPSNKELRKLMTHVPVHGRALFLLLSSSGMRIGESLQLKLDDVNLEEEPFKIMIRGDNLFKVDD